MSLLSARIVPHSTVRTVTKLLKSPGLSELIVKLDGLGSPRGRTGYGTRALLGACLIKSLYALPTWSATDRLIRDHPGLQAALGGVPSQWACYRFARKIANSQDILENCIAQIILEIKRRNPGFADNISIDSTELPAYANGHRFLSKNGPLRERFSDSEASWGHRSAISTCKGGGFYGYKLHLAVCSETELPVAWRVCTAKDSDMRQASSLLLQIRMMKIRPKTVAMDKAYDYQDVYHSCMTHRMLPVIAKRRNSGTENWNIDRDTTRFKSLYKGRQSVEREFGRLKSFLGLVPLRTRGLRKVRLHANLCLLARLALVSD